MKKYRVHNAAISQQDGYALLLILFLSAMLLVSAIVVTPNLLTQARREKEEEMIWRGKQYVRAISLYRRKTGRFPASLDDLTKGQTGIHFLRKQYKDPLNNVDGSWRLIFVGPAGQLIGSLNSKSVTGSFPLAPAGAASTPPATPVAAANSSVPSANPGVPASNPNQAASSGGSSATSLQPGQNDLPPGNIPDASPAFGASIVGVGGKIDHKSIITYNKARNYRLFEFIWDPTKELNASAVPGVSGQALSDPAFKPPQPAPADPLPKIPALPSPVEP